MPTKIEWTQETWNPITGCTPASAGCTNCYARRIARRLAGRHGYPEYPHHFDVTFHPDRLEQPLHWKKPRTVFVCSMSDFFHEHVDVSWMRWIVSIMIKANQHTYQILTKRPQRMMECLDWVLDGRLLPDKLPDHIWLGVTAENQEQADKRIPILLQIPAAVRFVSVEPMLEKMWIRKWLLQGAHKYRHDLHWVIIGAETGPGARPMDLDWARSIRDQCLEAGVPFFFKRDSAGGRKLDGRLWEEYP